MKSKQHLLSSPFSLAQQLHFFIPDSSPSPALLSELHRGRDLGSCGQLVTAPLCCSFLLPLFPCSSVDAPQPTVLQDKTAPPWALRGLQGDLCSSAWSTSSPSFFYLDTCRAVSHTVFPHSSLLGSLLPSLNTVF